MVNESLTEYLVYMSYKNTPAHGTKGIERETRNEKHFICKLAEKNSMIFHLKENTTGLYRQVLRVKEREKIHAKKKVTKERL